MKHIHALVLFLCCGLAIATPVGVAIGADAPVTIKLGASVSKTGHFWSEVGPFEKLIQEWVNVVNGRGGIMMKQYGKRLPLEFFVYDDKSDKNEVRKVYEQLVKTDKVDLLLGPYSSPLTAVAVKVAESNKIPLVGICANSPKLYVSKPKWFVGLIDLGPRYTYRYWDMIKQEGKAGSVAFVVEDTMHPIGVFNGSKKLAEEAGLEVLASEIVPADTRDFGKVVQTLREKNPDVIYVSANIPFAVRFMKEAQKANLRPKEYHCIHHSEVFRDSLGGTADQVVGQSYWTEGMKLGDPKLAKVLLRNSDISEPMYPWAPAYVAAFQVVESALERAGTLDRKELMKALKESSVETILGKATFHEDGYGSINTYPSQIQGGKYVIIWPPEVSTGKHVYPRQPAK